MDFDTFSKSDFRVVKVKECVEVPKSKKLLKFTLDDGSGQDRTILSGIKNFYTAEELVGKKLLAITNLPARKMMGEESCGMLLSAICDYDGEEMLNLIILDPSIPAGSKIILKNTLKMKLGFVLNPSFIFIIGFKLYNRINLKKNKHWIISDDRN